MYALKSCIASLAIIACVVVVYLILCFKGYCEFVYQLVLYLMVPDILESLTNILEWLPVSLLCSLCLLNVPTTCLLLLPQGA